MSKRRSKKNNQYSLVSKPYTLEEIDTLQQRLDIERDLLIQKGLTSNDPIEILRTQKFLEGSRKKEEDTIKSFLFNPDISSLNNNNYRTPIKKVSYETLKRMARTPIIRTVIGTRVDQVAGFAEPTNNEQEKGWTIRKKRLLFDEDKETTNEEKKKISSIVKFICEGGTSDNKWSFDSFEEYLRQLTYDSLTFDQMCMENVYSRGKKLVQYYPVDGSTIRLVDDTDTQRLSQYTQQVNGYWPKYVQVWQDQIYAFYYPWEMTFGVRNKVTDINTNGYGISELEDLVNIVTWLLFGMQYNGNFFSQGSNPKGFFSIEGNVAPNALNDFKQMWRNTIAGIQNSHKVPVIESGSAKVNWVDMQASNKDMEFDNWLDFLIVISCCVFKIDPTECGFNLQKASQIFGQDGQKARLKHSQSKGLVPILKLIQRMFTRYIVEPLDENYEFVFTGLEIDDQEVALDMDVKKVQNGFMSLEDGFKKYSGREFDPEKDTILNNTYVQIQQQKMMGGDGMNQIVEDEMGGFDEGNPFAEPTMPDNPFEKSLTDYIESLK